MKDNTRKLKELQTQLTQQKKNYEKLQENISTLKKHLTLAQEDITKTQKEIDKLSRQEIISEHAILRYLERVKGLDIETIKQEILNCNNNIHFRKVYKDNVVVTIET